MALDVKQGNFTKSTGGAPASQVITGVGFQPKALILWATAQTVVGIADGYQLCMGFTDGTTDYSVTATSEDGQAASDSDKRDAVKVLTLLNFAQVVLAECDLTSFDADGFTLNWTINDGNAYIIHYLALGGFDLTDVAKGSWTSPAVTGNQAVTGVGFQPDALLFIARPSTASPPLTGPAAFLVFGIAVSSAQRGAIVAASRNGENTMSTDRHQVTDKCLVWFSIVDQSIIEAADFVSMDADGFTVNWADINASAYRYHYLALKGGQYFVGVETQKTSTGTKATTGVGFTPTGLFAAAFNRVASASPVPHNRVSIGAASGAGDEGAVWAGDTDGVADSSANMSTSTAKVLQHIDLDSPVDAPEGINAEADLDSFDSDGFTFDWTTADAVAREFLFLAFGSTPVVGVPVGAQLQTVISGR